jgi:hypothetical protein
LSVPRSTAGDVHERVSIKPIQSTGKTEPQAALSILVYGIAPESEVGIFRLDLGEYFEVDAVVTVYAMASGAHPDVAIPVFQDGVDLIFGQARDVWKSGNIFAVPHAQGATFLT